MATLKGTYLFSRIFGCPRLSGDYEALGPFKKYWHYQHMGCVISLGAGKANRLKEVNIRTSNFKDMIKMELWLVILYLLVLIE